jgi:hypothetical protein
LKIHPSSSFGCWFFEVEFFEFPAYSGHQSLIRWIAGKDFLTFCGESCKSSDCFFCCTETFWFDAVPFDHSLNCWAVGVLLGESLPMFICCTAFSTTSCSCFRVSGLILRSLIHFELILVQVERQDHVSVFYMWISSFPSNICWGGCLSSLVYFEHLCQKSVGCSCVDLCLGLVFCSFGLCVFFGPIPCCFYYYGSVE